MFHKVEAFPPLPLQDRRRFQAKDQALATAPILRQASSPTPTLGLAEALPPLVLLLPLRQAPPPRILYDGGNVVDPLQSLHGGCQT